MRKLIALIPCFLLLSTFSSADQVTFSKVKTRFSKPNDRRMVDKDVTLTLDDATQKLIVRGEHQPLDITYAQVRKVVFEVSSHMRGGAMSQVVGGIAGAAMAAGHVNDYWCYLEYSDADGKSRNYLLEVDKDDADEVITKFRALFGDKVTEMPTLVGADIEKSLLKDLQSKHNHKTDEKNHPMPELKPDKALVVVACPSLAARYAGKGIEFKVHANDRVILVNKWGTYSFAYVDPGEYLLASQSENASGFKMKLEAGKDYYFFQNTFMGAWKARTDLSQQSKERVMYEIDGSYFSDWSLK